MELKETVQMMDSVDYKERFKAEYLQLKRKLQQMMYLWYGVVKHLKIRMTGLSNMLKKYKEGTLTFKPSCSYDLLNAQFKSMQMYASYLEERAAIENIELGVDK